MADVNIGSASAATEKNEENEEEKRHFSQNKALLQRPPSGRSQKRTADPGKNHASTITTTHLLFEPTPPLPQQSRSAHTPRYRRIHSAHGRIGGPSQPNRTQNAAYVKNKAIVNKTRPQSAVETGSRQSVLKSSHVPKQLITLNVTHTVESVKETKKTLTNGCGTCNSERTSLQHSHPCNKGGVKVKKTQQERIIPKGIVQLAPWLTENVPEGLCGVDPKTCLMFLPCVTDMDDELPPELPPVQHHDECVIPYTVIPPALKPFDPKKLFHYDVERHIAEAEAFYDRRNIYSVDGRLLHEEKNYSQERTANVIQQEIEDLEGLLAGIGRADGNSIVVQYQEEINKLQRDVRKTLATCPKYEKQVEEEPPDLMGLRAFIREREEVISKIRARRKACVTELDSMALEAEVGMTMQKEVLDALKNL